MHPERLPDRSSARAHDRPVELAWSGEVEDHDVDGLRRGRTEEDPRPSHADDAGRRRMQRRWLVQ